MTDALVRRAVPADADLVARLLFDFNTEFETPTPDTETFSGRFRTLLAREDVVVLLAGDDGTDGFAFLTLRPTPYADGPTALLEELYVRPALRDRGIGTALLAEAMALARDSGVEEMQINVDEIDTDTIRFYERHGFRNLAPGADYRMLFFEREL